MLPEKATLVYESRNSQIFLDTTAERPVLIKMLRDEHPGPKRIQHFYNEFEYTKDLELSAVRKALKKDKIDGHYLLYLEYFEGDTIEREFVLKDRSLKEKLILAIAIAEAVAQIHQSGIIHKDLTAKNILTNKSGDSVKIIDFGISSKIDLKTPQLGNPELLEGTLQYFSPEQTGRMNRVVDYRTDLYSLGVIFYQIFTGQVPFTSEDAIEMVHMHLAKEPLPPHKLKPDLPEQVSKIILKLMNKNAEDRYQSAHGLKKDLDLCLQMWVEKERIDPFKLSDRDFTGTFRLPQKLYGRDEELKMLMSAFERVSKGSRETILVSGYSGIGKSALVNEIHKPITEKRGYFITGKYDQYKRNVPYSAITDAFNEFCNYLLAEHEDRLNQFKKDILLAVGELGGVLTAIIPKLELIIGQQPEVAKLEPEENKARLLNLFQKFIQTISAPDHPIVLFLDDLQWIDPASINLLKSIMSDDENSFLLIIGAYRDNEVDENHPLMLMLDEIQTEIPGFESIIHTINLDPLTKDEVNMLIADTFPGQDSIVEKLSSLVFNKTRGNAFFVVEFLRSLYENQKVKFNFKTSSWEMDVKAIEAMEITDNVINLMTHRLFQLPEETLEILKIASCIGNRFELSKLEFLSDEGIKKIFWQLWSAIEQELILPIDENYKFLQADEDLLEPDQEIAFRFLHDRVQQATYSLLSTEEKKKIHFRIGKLLLEDQKHLDSNLFDIVNHLNEGKEYLKSEEEQLELALLNLQAGIKARISTAYHSAKKYLENATAFLRGEYWETNYRDAFNAHIQLAEVYYLNGEFQHFDKVIERCEHNAKSALDESEISYQLILRHTMTSEHERSIEFARQGLKKLGVDFPKTSEEAEQQIPTLLGEIIQYFEAEGIDQIYDLPTITDREQLAIMKLLDNISMPSYVSGALNIWTIHVLMKIKYTIENGTTPEAAYAFSELALIFCIQGMFNYGQPCGKLSKKLSDKYEQVSLRHKSRSLHLINNYIEPWFRNIAELDQPIAEALRVSMDAGEIIFAGYLRYHLAYNWFYNGHTSLHKIQSKLPAAIQFSKRIKHDLAYDSLLALEMIILNLKGNTKNKTTFSYEELTEETFLDSCIKKQNYYAVSVFRTYKASTLFLQKEYKSAYDEILEAKKIVAPLRGNMVHYTHFLFYEAIINFARIKINKGGDSGAERKVIRENLEQLRSFAEPGPFNLLHKVYLISALEEWLSGHFNEAQKLFHDSIAEAKEKEFYQNAAITHELMGEFWKELNQGMYVKAHTVEAYQNYLIWGADSIAKKLRSESPAYFKDNADSATFSLSQSAVSGSLHGGMLDLMSVVKASQAIYGEIDVDTLLKRLIQVVMQNAGASRLALFLEKNGDWILEADGADESINTQREILDELENTIPKSLITYAIRTQEEVLINDTGEEHLFTRDPYLKKSAPASIWAIPLYAKNKMNGLLYLENKIASNAFTSKRQQVIRLLTAQITISIENAYLYSNLKQLNTAYQKFVPLEFLSLLGHTSILDVALGDQTERNLTVMFLDIRDYTTISESMSPEENFNFINAFLAKVFPIINKHKGSVNQLLGDGIMSLFENPNDCLRSAIEIQHTMENYNEEREKENLDRLRVGIGMHSGRTMIGIIGDHKRHDTGVISKVVNTASRVEGLTKVFGASIVLSEDTLAGIVNPELYNYRFLGIVQVKGTQEAIKVYEFYDGDPAEVRDMKKTTEKDFTRGLKEYFNKDFVMAAAHLKKVLATNPGDRTANRYFRHAAEYMINGVDDDWTGVEHMEVK